MRMKFYIIIILAVFTIFYIISLINNSYNENYNNYFRCRHNRKNCFGKNKELKKQTIKEFIKIISLLDKHNIKGFLSSGTILGYVRENDLLRNDDDISIGIFANKNNINIVKNLFKKLGYRTKIYYLKMNGKNEIGQFTFKKSYKEYEVEFDVEIFFNDIKNNKYVMSSFWKPTAFYPFNKFNIKKIEFLGSQFYIPANPVYFVKQLYGKKWNIEKPMFHHTEYGNRIIHYDRNELTYFKN